MDLELFKLTFQPKDSKSKMEFTVSKEKNFPAIWFSELYHFLVLCKKKQSKPEIYTINWSMHGSAETYEALNMIILLLL